MALALAAFVACLTSAVGILLRARRSEAAWETPPAGRRGRVLRYLVGLLVLVELAALADVPLSLGWAAMDLAAVGLLLAVGLRLAAWILRHLAPRAERAAYALDGRAPEAAGLGERRRPLTAAWQQPLADLCRANDRFPRGPAFRLAPQAPDFGLHLQMLAQELALIDGLIATSLARHVPTDVREAVADARSRYLVLASWRDLTGSSEPGALGPALRRRSAALRD